MTRASTAEIWGRVFLRIWRAGWWFLVPLAALMGYVYGGPGG